MFDHLSLAQFFFILVVQTAKISAWLPWEESRQHLSEWSNTLKISGYSENERFDAIRGAVTRQEEMKRLVSTGDIASLHRSRNEILRSKSKKSGILASTWFLKG